MLKGMPNSQESAEWSGGCQTGIKAPSNQDGKEGSQGSARSVPSDQKDIERSVVSRGRLAARRAGEDRKVLSTSSFQMAPACHVSVQSRL